MAETLAPPGTLFRVPDTRARGTVLRQCVLFAAAYLTYFGVRGLVEERVDAALANARAITAFERSAGFFVEPAVQSAAAGSAGAAAVWNAIYLWGHWPVIVLVGLWLFSTRRGAFGRYRNAILISGAIGLVLFATFPTAPPRLAGLGLVDTVAEQAKWYRVLQPPAFTNQYAAFPSLHVGWNLLIGVALIREADRLPLRIFGVVMPVLMAAAVVATANHYVVDAIAGSAIALAGLGLAGLRVPYGRLASRSAAACAGAVPSDGAAMLRFPVVPSTRMARHARCGRTVDGPRLRRRASAFAWAGGRISCPHERSPPRHAPGRPGRRSRVKRRRRRLRCRTRTSERRTRVARRSSSGCSQSPPS